MNSKCESSTQLRVHEELLRGHVETGFSLAHVAEMAFESGETADFRRAMAEARDAVIQTKRLLRSIGFDSTEDYESELELLQFELNDLEARST
jgi:hypothetical protein